MRKEDKFYTKTKCDRCPNDLKVRTMSWFTDEAICLSCARKESALKKALFARGEDLAALEGCGYLPKVEGIEDLTA